MKFSRWKDIDEARKLLELPAEVTRLEIQEAYRKKCREFHPDQAGDETSAQMISLNSAYKVLMDYVDNYTIKFGPNEEGMTDEEWWMYHFGQDPIWTSER